MNLRPVHQQVVAAFLALIAIGCSSSSGHGTSHPVPADVLDSNSGDASDTTTGDNGIEAEVDSIDTAQPVPDVADVLTGPETAGACKKHLDCADTNPCTDDTCTVDGTCQHTNNSAPCDDGDGCTVNEHCEQGACKGSGSCVDTWDTSDGNTLDIDDAATSDTYDTDTLAPDAPDGLDADDVATGDAAESDAGGNLDVAADVSETGCQSDLACADGNACTADSCEAGACLNVPAPATCDDGDACTTDDACVGVVCKGTVKTCDDTNPCTTDTCSAGDCTWLPSDVTVCDDGNACTMNDNCQNGTCLGASPVLCQGEGACHVAGTCDPNTGNCSGPAKADGTACNDGDACTQVDTCQAGTCTGTGPKACAAIDQCHSAGTCDPASGTCSTPHKDNGTTCNDGDACTQTDACQFGTCIGASPKACTAGDQCHTAGTCDPSSGTCSNPAKDNGAPCDDGDKCTAGDACTGGACAGTVMACDDGVGCTNDSCGTASGCVHADNCGGDTVCDLNSGACKAAPGGCSDAADVSYLADGTKAQGFKDAQSTCVPGCLAVVGNVSQQVCVADCIGSKTPLSGSCSACYGGYAWCSATQCSTQCAAGPSAPGCVDCLAISCAPALQTCADAPAACKVPSSWSPNVQKVSKLAIAAATKGCDLDGDGKPNNVFGKVLSLLSQSNTQLAAAVADGTIVLLLDAQGYKTDASTFAIDLLTGDFDKATLPACDPSAATCNYTITAGSYDTAAAQTGMCPVRMNFPDAKDEAGTLTSSSTGTFTLSLPVLGSAVLRLKFRQGSISGATTEANTWKTTSSGMFCGVVSQDDLNIAIDALPPDVLAPLGGAAQFKSLISMFLKTDIALTPGGPKDGLSAAFEFETLPGQIVGVQTDCGNGACETGETGTSCPADCNCGLAGCDDGIACTKDVCNPAVGVCSHAAVSDGTVCDDGDACTLNDACQSGACQPGAAKPCGVGQSCVAGACLQSAPDGMVVIPGGSFQMGCVPASTSCNADQKPRHSVTLASYFMDVYEVTVAKYELCVKAGVCTAPKCPGLTQSELQQHPTECVDWGQADAYCQWAGRRLPTEAEWEKAARGGQDGNVYPWGNVLDCAHAVWDGAAGTGCDGASSMPVGSKPLGKNGYGLYDMTGNVWEWVADWYDVNYYPASPAENPMGPSSGTQRVMRGGGYDQYTQMLFSLTVATRYGSSPTGASLLPVGFRCAKSMGCSSASDCNDKNACTADVCDTATGACSNIAVTDGAACDDGNPCTSGDNCSGTLCVGASLAVGTSCDLIPDDLCAGGGMCGTVECLPLPGSCTSCEGEPTCDAALGVLGPSGGTLEHGGVAVWFPDGAILKEQVVALFVGPGPVIHIEPDLELDAPARVALDIALWPNDASSTVVLSAMTGDDWHAVDDLRVEPDGYVFYPIHFSALTLVGMKLAQSKTWEVGDYLDTKAQKDSTGNRQCSKLEDIRAGGLLSNVKALGIVTDGDSVTEYKAERLFGDDETFLVSQEMEAPLTAAAKAVKVAFPGYRLYLNAAFDSSGKVHSANSYHNYGAAIDITLCKPKQGATVCTAADKVTMPKIPGTNLPDNPDAAKLGLLAPILANAGFTWVLYEDANHVHASMVSPSVGVTAPMAKGGPAVVCVSCNSGRHGANEECCRLATDSGDLACKNCGQTDTYKNKKGITVEAKIEYMTTQPNPQCCGTHLCQCGAVDCFAKSTKSCSSGSATGLYATAERGICTATGCKYLTNETPCPSGGCWHGKDGTEGAQCCSSGACTPTVQCSGAYDDSMVTGGPSAQACHHSASAGADCGPIWPYGGNSTTGCGGCSMSGGIAQCYDRCASFSSCSKPFCSGGSLAIPGDFPMGGGGPYWDNLLCGCWVTFVDCANGCSDDHCN